MQLNSRVLLKKNKKGAEIYMNSLLVIDYRKYRSRPKIATERLIISGTPASMENQHQKQENLNWLYLSYNRLLQLLCSYQHLLQ